MTRESGIKCGKTRNLTCVLAGSAEFAALGRWRAGTGVSRDSAAGPGNFILLFDFAFMKIEMRYPVRGLWLLLAVLPLANCESTGGGGGAYSAPAAPVARGLRYGSDDVSRAAIDRLGESGSASVKRRERPGLATAAGDERFSSVGEISFYRKATNSPDAVDSFLYNDSEGAKAMAEALGGGRKRSGTFEVADGRLEVSLRPGSWGSPYERYEAGGKRIVIGSRGSAYELSVRNRTAHAVEVVASVDGLDVMDGKAAGVRKRGYIIPAKERLDIEGFRVNNSKVRQFVFGGVDASAAARAGAARNVGVIGLAVYDEDEAQAKLARLVESRQRSGASAFPVSTR